VQADLRAHLEEKFGVQSSELYWKIFEDLRGELGYADYLGALQRYRSVAPDDPDLLLMSDYLIDYPFADRLYPGALAALETARAAGPTVILSDGDVVFQPRKIRRSGIWDAVEGRVLIYVHKEAMLEDMQARYPALRYVMVDDKLRILAAMKQVLGERLFTVFPRQGHYARDAAAIAGYPAADLTIGSIGELARWDWPSSLSGAR
jgi:FMN phosphatase YigB (HAD superfamily)